MAALGPAGKAILIFHPKEPCDCVKEDAPVTYASVNMIRFLIGLPPENAPDTYINRLADKSEEIDPGAEISHNQAIRLYEHRRCFPKRR